MTLLFRFAALVAPVALVALGHGEPLRIVHSSQQTWAELRVRVTTDTLIARGHDVVLSSPWKDQCDTGICFGYRQRFRTCQYRSCILSDDVWGRNLSQPHLHWVKGSTKKALRLGIDKFGPELWQHKSPDLAVIGPGFGTVFTNQDMPLSLAIGAASFAVKNARVPAIVVTVNEKGHLPWFTTPVPLSVQIYAELVAKLVDTLAESGKPLIPDRLLLSVNIPPADASCDDVSKFPWILTRVGKRLMGDDIAWCGTKLLPTEWQVMQESTLCAVSVSFAYARTLRTPNDHRLQRDIRNKLRPILSCIDVKNHTLISTT
ncbi:hypothetical protein RJ55_08249 [Drechmeria coniospora]|nr:hypothetical protein RJ55_08249 [Drechmeria coniospora]